MENSAGRGRRDGGRLITLGYLRGASEQERQLPAACCFPALWGCAALCSVWARSGGVIPGLWALCLCPRLWSVADLEPDPSIRVVQPVSVAGRHSLLYIGVHVRRFGEAQTQPTRNYQCCRAFPCVRPRSELWNEADETALLVADLLQTDLWGNHPEPLANPVWELPLNFAFSWGRTK